MEALQVASRVRQWAALGMTVDKANFGLRLVQKEQKLDETSRECLKEGLDLFKLLRQGEQVFERGNITEARQLDALLAFEPLEKKPEVEKGRLSGVIALFKGILNHTVDLHNGPEQINKAIDLLRQFSKAYEQTALEELDTIERPPTGNSTLAATIK